MHRLLMGYLLVLRSTMNHQFFIFPISCFKDAIFPCNYLLEVRKVMFKIILERRASTYIIQPVTCKNYALFSKDFVLFWVHGWEGLKEMLGKPVFYRLTVSRTVSTPIERVTCFLIFSF